jgi:hypothetical protein
MTPALTVELEAHAVQLLLEDEGGLPREGIAGGVGGLGEHGDHGSEQLQLDPAKRALPSLERGQGDGGEPARQHRRAADDGAGHPGRGGDALDHHAAQGTLPQLPGEEA